MDRRAILCVDDEPIILLALVQELRKSLGTEFLLERAMGPEEALGAMENLEAEGTSLALVISDWLMPGMKGDELMVAIWQRLPETPVIFITGWAEAPAIERIRQSGPVLAVLKKPWDSRELRELILSNLRPQ